MTDDRLAEVHQHMRLVPITWALRWCGKTGECACQGCAANAVGKHDVTRAEWQEWWVHQFGNLGIDKPAFPFPVEAEAAT